METPNAVNVPADRPPTSEFLTVKAVSGPGVAMTTIERPRNVRSADASMVSVVYESDSHHCSSLRSASPHWKLQNPKYSL